MALRRMHRLGGATAVAILALIALANPASAFADNSHAGGNGRGVATGNPHREDEAPDLVTTLPDPVTSTATLSVAVAPTVSTGSGTSGSGLQAQPRSNADNNGRGSNVTGDFDSTRQGLSSHNGNATTQPAAAAKGKADNKNPPGQLLNDRNRGYECDGNRGIGKTNPAHTGCPRPTTQPPCRDTPGHPCNPCRDAPGNPCNPCTSNCASVQSVCVAGDPGCTSVTPPGRVAVLGLTVSRPAVVLGDVQVAGGTLPVTGTDTTPLLLAAALLILTGLVLVRRAERTPAPVVVPVRRSPAVALPPVSATGVRVVTRRT